ncbi:hypothetical protein N0V90_001512 [Kalmusia sp. IMI 367209]|nr:hypothetical protein N0V90_001512 [Kalmusia sp. IMI 367209]
MMYHNEYLMCWVYVLPVQLAAVQAAFEDEMYGGEGFYDFLCAEEHNTTFRANSKGMQLRFLQSGIAETGKSTIMRTIAQPFHHHGQLGACFFFKGDKSDRESTTRALATIASNSVVCQLDMLLAILKAIDKDSAILDGGLDDESKKHHLGKDQFRKYQFEQDQSSKKQFEKMVIHWFLGSKQARPQELARIVVMDALDEHKQRRVIRTTLQLSKWIDDICPVSLRVVAPSQLEVFDHLELNDMSIGGYHDLVCKILRTTTEHGMGLILLHELGAIQKTYVFSSVLPSMRQMTAVQLLMQPFLYAAKIWRYVGIKDENSKSYLEESREYKEKSTVSQLEQFCLPVLDLLFVEQKEDEKETWFHAFRELIGSIMDSKSLQNTTSFEYLLQVLQEELVYQLDYLQSVFNVPDSGNVRIKLAHLSAREVLTKFAKRGNYPTWVDEESADMGLVSHCLKLMSKSTSVRQNLWDSSGSGILRNIINKETNDSSLSLRLEYMCQFWDDHLELTQQGIVDGATMDLILQMHLLRYVRVAILEKDKAELNSKNLHRQTLQLWTTEERTQILHALQRVMKTWPADSQGTSSVQLQEIEQAILQAIEWTNTKGNEQATFSTGYTYLNEDDIHEDTYKLVEHAYTNDSIVHSGEEIFADYEIPNHKDFMADPAHDYWTWSEKMGNWWHKDENMDDLIWAPLDFD